VVNSGNANACTGKQGMKDAREMTAVLAKELHMPEAEVLVGSTGRIGVTMPMANVKSGILHALQILGNAPKQAEEAAEAIMTSDTKPKQIAVEFTLGGKKVRIGGICKGAGMIQPGMSATGARPAALPHGGLHATMLCFITTDAAIGAKVLQAALQEAVAQSFNRITVDGDMSTNDTVLVLANGLAENEKSKVQIPNWKNISGGAQSRHAGTGEDDCARWRRRASRGDGAGEWCEDDSGRGRGGARGGEQCARENKLARRRSELGSHH
jgi:glutamate N-acetyltransferase/amino-acid N-acetyltransferase